MSSKKIYHITPQGEVEPCSARPGNCPFSDFEDHKTSPQAARAHYEKLMQHQLFTGYKSTLTNLLIANNNGRFPEETLVQLGGLLESKPFVVMEVIPAGSVLYNTEIPGRATHDYDFTVLTEPHSRLKHKNKKYMQDTLDVNVIPVTKITDAAGRSTSLSESFYALQSNEQLLSTAKNSNWRPYLSSLKLPMIKYYDLLDDVKRSHDQRFTEPATQDDKVNFKNFKHCVRWSIYQKRWSDGLPNDSFNPRLSDDERAVFLRAIESGYINSIYDD